MQAQAAPDSAVFSRNYPSPVTLFRKAAASKTAILYRRKSIKAVKQATFTTAVLPHIQTHPQNSKSNRMGEPHEKR